MPSTLYLPRLQEWRKTFRISFLYVLCVLNVLQELSFKSGDVLIVVREMNEVIHSIINACLMAKMEFRKIINTFMRLHSYLGCHH